MRILIAGAGAIGGFFGGKLLQAGRNVTFFVRRERVVRFIRDGFSIRTPDEDIHLAAPPATAAGDLREPFDLVLLSCKAQDLPVFMESFAPAVGPGTLIIPLLNGMRHLDMLDARFGGDRVLGGGCLISATQESAGLIVQFTRVSELFFGARNASHAGRTGEILAALSNAGFDAQLRQNILQHMWDKWVFIGTGAAMTCLMRASIGDIVAAGASGLTLALLEESAAIASREGFPCEPAVIARARETLTQPGSLLMASMLRDVERNAGVEADHILGDLVLRAEKHGLPVPLLRIADAHLKSYEARRTREGADSEG